MPNDPLGILATQMNSALSEFNRGFSQFNAEMFGNLSKQAAALNDIAPHNVLGKMGLGSGMFSAKTTTQTLNERNIFGG